MEKNNYLLMNASILHRCTQKYYDKQLLPYEFGAGQLLFLILIYEQEGMTMQSLASMGNFDKGTITKGIQKLEELGYVKTQVNDHDKRVRFLYTTDKTKEIIANIYLIRQEWWQRITQGMSEEESSMFEKLLDVVAKNAGDYMVEQERDMRFFGMQKLTLLDYPGKLATTLFTGGCNFKCPFCHNGDLVFLPENAHEITEEEVLEFLEKRKGILEGVCISGGEPLMHDEIEHFLRKVKELGYPVKLDTNGSYPDKIKYLVEEGLVDYVAMDIKNSINKYPNTIGTHTVYLDAIKESVSYLLEDHVDYEFRTTLVKQFHNIQDIIDIGQWIKGAKRYYLQAYVDGENVLEKGLEPLSKEIMEECKEVVKKYVNKTYIRGI